MIKAFLWSWCILDGNSKCMIKLSKSFLTAVLPDLSFLMCPSTCTYLCIFCEMIHHLCSFVHVNNWWISPHMVPKSQWSGQVFWWFSFFFSCSSMPERHLSFASPEKKRSLVRATIRSAPKSPTFWCRCCEVRGTQLGSGCCLSPQDSFSIDFQMGPLSGEPSDGFILCQLILMFKMDTCSFRFVQHWYHLLPGPYFIHKRYPLMTVHLESGKSQLRLTCFFLLSHSSVHSCIISSVGFGLRDRISASLLIEPGLYLRVNL